MTDLGLLPKLVEGEDPGEYGVPPPLPTAAPRTLLGAIEDAIKSGRKIPFDQLILEWYRKEIVPPPLPPIPDIWSDEDEPAAAPQPVRKAPPRRPVQKEESSSEEDSDSDEDNKKQKRPSYFKGAGDQIGTEIWRIENMAPVRIPLEPPPNPQGFFKGDSYIVLETQSEENGTLKHQVFYWVGEQSSRDEYITAAFASKTLAGILGCRQTREDMSSESKEFLAIFWYGIKLLEGGTESVLKHVDTKPPPRLYLIKGAKNPRITRVPTTWRSLNQGDVFVLDCQDVMYQWNGCKCAMREKGKALAMTSKIIGDERGGKCATIVIEELDGDKPDQDHLTFWKHLGGENGHAPINPADPPEEDINFEQEMSELTFLYLITENDGKLDWKNIEERPFVKPMLQTKHCAVIDTPTDVFVWVGKESSELEKAGAMQVAEHFFKNRDGGRPEWSLITRVAEGTETFLFIENFKDWAKPLNAAKAGAIRRVMSRKSLTPPPKLQKYGSVVDVGELYKKKQAKRADEITDDKGNGNMTIIVFESDARAFVLSHALYGQFYSADVFLVVYVYDTIEKEGYPSMKRCLLYFWEGHDADKKIWLAYQQSELKAKFDNSGSVPTTIRLQQRKETEHFLNVFKGHMVVHKGHTSKFIPIPAETLLHMNSSKAKAVTYQEGEFCNSDTLEQKKDRHGHLYHVRGFDATHTTAYEVAFTASSLNSDDAFLLHTAKDQVHIWLGSGSNNLEQSMARDLARKMLVLRLKLDESRDYVDSTDSEDEDDGGGHDDRERRRNALFHSRIFEHQEGRESQAFWEELGGQGDYVLNSGGAPERKPRLFQCSVLTGHCVVEEIYDFIQDDLDENSTMLLDVGRHIFIWSRRTLPEREKRVTQAKQIAQAYIENDPEPRGDVQISEVDAGSETSVFTCHFQGWERKVVKVFVDPRERIMQKQAEELALKRKRMRQALNDDICTFSVTGGDMDLPQTWISCLTCGLNGPSVGACLSCARICHAGHSLGEKKTGQFACSCGAGVCAAITPCKCMK